MTELVAMRGPAMLHRVRNKVKVNIDININVKGSGQECPLLTGLTGFARPPAAQLLASLCSLDSRGGCLHIIQVIRSKAFDPILRSGFKLLSF
jgi:hypothetical protein